MNDYLLPVVKEHYVTEFIKRYMDNNEQFSIICDRIKKQNSFVYDYIEGVVDHYENKNLARLCAAGTYILMEKSSGIPFVEDETLKLFSSELKEPDSVMKLLVEIKDKNPTLFDFYAALDTESSPQESIINAGLSVYGLLRTQAKKNLFAKFKREKQIGLEDKVIN